MAILSAFCTRRSRLHLGHHVERHVGLLFSAPCHHGKEQHNNKTSYSFFHHVPSSFESLFYESIPRPVIHTLTAALSCPVTQTHGQKFPLSLGVRLLININDATHPHAYLYRHTPARGKCQGLTVAHFRLGDGKHDGNEPVGRPDQGIRSFIRHGVYDHHTSSLERGQFIALNEVGPFLISHLFQIDVPRNKYGNHG